MGERIMTSNYYNKMKRLVHFLEDNNIELESCGCCDGVVIDGEGGWDSGISDYSVTVSNSALRKWLYEHEYEKRDDE